MTQIGPQNLFSQQLHGEKYRADGESYDDYAVRYSRATADGEEHFHHLLDMTRGMRFLPGGRQQRAVGTPHQITAFNCLGGETPVLTRERGLVPISEVVGVPVHVVNRSGEWSEVVFRSYGVQPLRTIQLRQGKERTLRTVRATDGHRWFAANGTEFTTADLLRRGAKAAGLFDLATATPREGEPIVQGEYDEGLLHGIVYGDGSREASGSYSVKLSGPKRAYLPLIEEVTGCTGTVQFRPDLDCEIDRIGGFRRETDLKAVPTGALCTTSYVRGFLAGVMATDGSVMRHAGGMTYAKAWGSAELVDFLERWFPVTGVQTKCKRKMASEGDETNLCTRRGDVWEISLVVPTIDQDLILREDHAEILSSRRTQEDGLMTSWKVVSVSQETVEEEVFCCEEPRTHAFAVLGSCLTSNCFVANELEDSMDSIMSTLAKGAVTMRAGGGKGWDFSPLRPEGDRVNRLGDGAYASGPISFMGMWDAMCRTIMSGGGRRGAMMGVLRVDHPDVRMFLHAKRIPSDVKVLWDIVEEMPDGPLRTQAVMALQRTLPLTSFNISLAITDAFMEAVKTDGLFDLHFGGRSYGQVRALDLWAEMMESNWDWAEPGVLFIDRINKMNPLAYCETISATNPCVTGDTEILTDAGYFRIDSLVGQRVKVWDGERFEEVEPRVTGRNQEIVEVELSNGVTLRCTPYHRFVVDGSDEFVEARHLEEGDGLARFDMPLVEGGEDHPEAYTQGFYSGDGWVNHAERESRSALIALYGDKKRLVDEFAGVRSVSEIANPNGGGTRDYVYLEQGVIDLDKSFVPLAEWSVASRLEWLAGLMDSDGTAVKNNPALGDASPRGVQITSIDKEFLLRVRRLLTTLGVADVTVAVSKRARAEVMSDGAGGMKAYQCAESYRLSVSAWWVRHLLQVGLRTRRLKLNSEIVPKHYMPKSVTVVEVRSTGEVASEVFCFTNLRTQRGCFAGVITANCAEQPLPPNGACLLASMNMTKYLRPRGVVANVHPMSRYEIDMDLLERDVRAAVRAVDNVIDRTQFPLPEQAAEAKAKRRMGLGYTGMANALETVGLPYGTEGYIREMRRVHRFMTNTAYRASIELAREKGSFPLFDAEKWLASGFATSGALDDDVLHGIRTVGLRNGLLMSIAPTGTISLTADNVSSGGEPVFALKQTRTVTMQDGKVEVDLDDYAYTHFGTVGRTADEVTPQEHIDVLCAMQEFTDSAVSKTCNVYGKKAGKGPGISFDDFKGLYMRAYDGGAKGCTTFNSNGKRMGILTAKKPDEAPAEVAAGTGTDGMACFFDPATGMKTCE